jgi:indole-3-glycerol phosphate synthase
VTARRLSQAISEGDGISVLVEVRGALDARAAERQGADGLVVRESTGSVRGASQLPVLAYGPSLHDAVDAEADAVVLAAESESEHLAGLAEEASELGLECVLRVRDEDDLERVLEHLDPEIFLLVGDDEEDEPLLERLLALLPDIPAGKLAIAELGSASRTEIEELERAGVDAVLVGAGNVEQLVGDTPPEV